MRYVTQKNKVKKDTQLQCFTMEMGLTIIFKAKLLQSGMIFQW